MKILFFCEENNHVQLSPELKVNQLLQMIDLEIVGIHIDLRAANLIDRDIRSSLSIKVFITIQKARRSCK